MNRLCLLFIVNSLIDCPSAMESCHRASIQNKSEYFLFSRRTAHRTARRLPSAEHVSEERFACARLAAPRVFPAQFADRELPLSSEYALPGAPTERVQAGSLRAIAFGFCIKIRIGVLKGPGFSRADTTGDDFPFLPLVEVFAARKPQPRAGKLMRRLLRHG